MRSYVPATHERDGVAPRSRSCAPGLNLDLVLMMFVTPCGAESVKCRFIEFFVLDYDSFPYLLSLLFWSGVILIPRK